MADLGSRQFDSTDMRFYDRKEELDKLQEINSLPQHTARMAVITGRRWIGKTSLVLKAYENEIDIIAVDNTAHTITFFEVKRQEQTIDLSILRAKAEKIMETTGRYSKYRKEYKGLSMEDM